MMITNLRLQPHLSGTNEFIEYISEYYMLNKWQSLQPGSNDFSLWQKLLSSLAIWACGKHWSTGPNNWHNTMSTKFPHASRASGTALFTGPIGNWLANQWRRASANFADCELTLCHLYLADGWMMIVFDNWPDSGSYWWVKINFWVNENAYSSNICFNICSKFFSSYVHLSVTSAKLILTNNQSWKSNQFTSLWLST